MMNDNAVFVAVGYARALQANGMTTKPLEAAATFFNVPVEDVKEAFKAYFMPYQAESDL